MNQPSRPRVGPIARGLRRLRQSHPVQTVAPGSLGLMHLVLLADRLASGADGEALFAAAGMATVFLAQSVMAGRQWRADFLAKKALEGPTREMLRREWRRER